MENNRGSRFVARYIGCGCFIRRSVDGRDETVFVKRANRPDWLIQGESYTLIAELSRYYGIVYLVDGGVDNE